MAHFMDVDGNDQARRHGPAEDTPIEAERDEHGKQRAHLRQAENQHFELPKQQRDGAEPAGNSLAPAACAAGPAILIFSPDLRCALARCGIAQFRAENMPALASRIPGLNQVAAVRAICALRDKSSNVAE